MVCTNEWLVERLSIYQARYCCKPNPRHRRGFREGGGGGGDECTPSSFNPIQNTKSSYQQNLAFAPYSEPNLWHKKASECTLSLLSFLIFLFKGGQFTKLSDERNAQHAFVGPPPPTTPTNPTFIIRERNQTNDIIFFNLIFSSPLSTQTCNSLHGISCFITFFLLTKIENIKLFSSFVLS